MAVSLGPAVDDDLRRLTGRLVPPGLGDQTSILASATGATTHYW